MPEAVLCEGRPKNPFVKATTNTRRCCSGMSPEGTCRGEAHFARLPCPSSRKSWCGHSGLSLGAAEGRERTDRRIRSRKVTDHDRSLLSSDVLPPKAPVGAKHASPACPVRARVDRGVVILACPWAQPKEGSGATEESVTPSWLAGADQDPSLPPDVPPKAPVGAKHASPACSVRARVDRGVVILACCACPW